MSSRALHCPAAGHDAPGAPRACNVRNGRARQQHRPSSGSRLERPSVGRRCDAAGLVIIRPKPEGSSSESGQSKAPMDRLTSLTVFVRVVDGGGFSAAARRLNMSTTMVSNHVQSLEDRLGVRLLNRTTRRVSLTEIGKGYYERCTQILAELDEADRMAGALQAMPRGMLRLYTGTHIVPFIAPVVAEFLALYPEVSIDLTMGERMIDLVEEGFDLAIRPTPPAGFEPDRPAPDLLAPHSLLLAGLSRQARAAPAAGRPRPAQLPALRLLPVRRRLALHRPGRRADFRPGVGQSFDQQRRGAQARGPERPGPLPRPDLRRGRGSRGRPAGAPSRGLRPGRVRHQRHLSPPPPSLGQGRGISSTWWRSASPSTADG